MWLARLRERYELADSEFVLQRCTAHPIDCRRPVVFEGWWMESHNAVVVADFRQELAEIKAGREAQLNRMRRERAERRARVGEALADGMRAYATSLQRGLTCTSTPVGGVAHTSCR